jgi:hypothetical protein
MIALFLKIKLRKDFLGDATAGLLRTAIGF